MQLAKHYSVATVLSLSPLSQVSVHM